MTLPDAVPSVDQPDPVPFAESWIGAWNARDLDAVLARCADDVVFSSPTARRVVPESGGTVRGKADLRRYWAAALRLNPDLHFELVDVYTGIDILVVHYRNQVGDLINEALSFRDGLVVAGAATHRHLQQGSEHARQALIMPW